MVLNGEGARDKLSAWLIVVLLCSATVLQKFSFPGTDSQVALIVAILYATCAVGLYKRKLAVRLDLFVLFCVLFLFGGVGYVMSDSLRKSYLSLALLAVMHLPYIFSLHKDAVPPEFPLRVFNRLMFWLGIAGITQFFLQFVVGSDVAFILDQPWVSGIRLSGYNNLNNFFYGSDVYKTNGVFFLEASTFNQCLCIALIVELIYFRRPIYFAVLSLACVLTFSGTGLILLAVVGPAAILRFRLYYLAACGAVGVLLIIIFAEQLGLSFYLNRVQEFQSERSSGFARFLSPFIYLDLYIFSEPISALLGRGPGSVTEYWGRFQFEVFDPSWAKTMYELGVGGSVIYWAFMGRAIFVNRTSKFICVAVLLEFAFLGGYTLVPLVHVQILGLLAWPHASPLRATGAVRGGADRGHLASAAN